MAELIAEDGLVALQYGSAQGDPELREQICEVMALEGIKAHPDDVVVTVGSQKGLDLVTRMFCDPGDVVLAEGPSYVGALGTFAAYQAQVVHVAMDDDGLVPEALREALARRRGRPAASSSSTRSRTSTTRPASRWPCERRAEMLEICREHGVLVVEDNPYGLLGFDGADLPGAAARRTPSDVVYLGSFSKTFAPGLRVGWVLAPHAVREKLVLAAEAATLCPPTLQPDDRVALPGHPRLAGPDQGVPRDLPRAPGRDAVARWSQLHARRAARGPSPTAASTSG